MIPNYDFLFDNIENDQEIKSFFKIYIIFLDSFTLIKFSSMLTFFIVMLWHRDRTSSVWPMVCDHLHALLMAAASADQQFLIERCVIGLLRLAIRLMRRDEISSSVSR